MPGIYKVDAQYFPGGVVTIETADSTETYSSIQQSFASSNFELANYYCLVKRPMAAQQQIAKPLYFRRYDVSGIKADCPKVITISPNQFQNAVSIPFPPADVEFNGQYFYEYDMLAGQQVFIVMDVYEKSAINLLPNKKSDVFFKNFKDSI